MKYQLRALFAGYLSLVLLPTMAPIADDGGLVELTFGPTNILCYQEPCPRYGISRADQPMAPHDLLWSGDVAPPMRGSDEDRIELLETYRQHCTLIRGRMENGVLEVAEILGAC